MKKAIKIIGIVILGIIVLAFVLPFLFKGKIMTLVKTEINKNINAKVDFTDVDISLFRHFPRLAVGLDNLTIVGVNKFAGDTLLSVKKMDGALNLISAIKGTNIKVYSVILQSPIVHAIINKDGKANWDIIKPSADTAVADTSKPFKMELQHYEINDGYITYDDNDGEEHAVIHHLNHSGSGDFTADIFTLKTSTTADAVDFIYDGIPYLYQTKASIDADIKVNNSINKYQFNTQKILLNGLPLSAAGFFQIQNDSSYAMDINFKAPSASFKNILSLVPGIYQHDFSKLKTSGTAAFSGFVKGIYNDQQIPAYGITLDVKNGFFKYPDLPGAVKNIQLHAAVNNPDGITDHTVINITQGHLEMNNQPFDFRLLLKNPVSSEYIDAALKGNIDLSQIAHFIKLEKGTQLSGLLNANVTATGSLAALQKQQYTQFDAAGNIAVNNLQYASAAMPSGIKISTLQLTFNPKNITVNNFNGQYLKTNFTASGEMNNMLLYIFQHQPLTGNLTVKADHINLNDWIGKDTTAATTATSRSFTVPDNIDFTLNTSVNEVQYNKLHLTNVSGQLVMKDQTVYLNNINADALGGTVAINGSYSTKENKIMPDISFDYDVKNLDVQKTFLALNTAQKLMPVAQFIDGKLSSQLHLTGRMGEDLSPVLNSLTGHGDVLLIQGLLNKFGPLEKLANALNIDALKNITFKDVKAYFSFENGRVNVKPFSFNVGNIDMQISGSHGFDQSLDYTIKMAIPRSLIGAQGNALINNLIAQANKNGIPVKLNDKINLQVEVGGTIKTPTIKTDLKQVADNAANNIKNQIGNYTQQQIDSAKQVIADSLNKVKKQLGKTLQQQAKQLLIPKDSAKKENSKTKENDKKAEQTLKNTLNSLFNKSKKDSGK